MKTTAVLCSVLGTWFVAGAWQSYNLAPPASATTLVSFSECMPAPTWLAAIDDRGQPKIVWVGETALLSIPSGPACYVFDTHGKLLDWSVETGDGQTTDKYLPAAFGSEGLTVAQAIELTDSAKGPGE